VLVGGSEDYHALSENFMQIHEISTSTLLLRAIERALSWL